MVNTHQTKQTHDLQEECAFNGYLYHIPSVPESGSKIGTDLLKTLAHLLVERLLANDKTLSALYFVDPLKVPREKWREANQKYAVCWEWDTGELIAMTERSKPTKEAEGPHASFLNKIAEAFPEQAGALAGASTKSLSERPAVIHLLKRSDDFATFFSNRRWQSPIEAFFGTGACMVFLVQSEESFFRLSRALIATRQIDAPRSLDFRIPFFTWQDFESAASPQLEEWFCLFSLYIAEMPDRQGLLVASPIDIGQVFEELWPILSGGDATEVLELQRMATG